MDQPPNRGATYEKWQHRTSGIEVAYLVMPGRVNKLMTVGRSWRQIGSIVHSLFPVSWEALAGEIS